MGWITKTGEYLSVLHSTINGAELGVQEWRDFLFLCYGIDTPNLPDHYNEYGAAFFICHSLDRKKLCLITARHNELRDGVADIAIKTFTLMQVREDPQIYTGHPVHGGK